MPSSQAQLASGADAAVRRPVWAWARLAGGVAILGFLLWRLGTGPFVRGLWAVNGWVLAVAAGTGALTTVAAAYRWCLVARGLGVRLPLGAAVAAYYRSQFLNTVLPGGVLGDVHRAVRHGRDAGDVARGLRAVAWERGAGQVVQGLLAVIVLVGLPSPVRGHMPGVTVLLAAAVGATVLVALALPRTGGTRWARAVRTVSADLREGLLARRNWPGIVLASTVVVAGHLATFLVAARAAGSTAPLSRLVPLGLLILVAMALPLNVGGWGPREGAAAWAFGAAGLTADLGVSTAVLYGVLVLAASLPGAAVLVAGRRAGRLAGVARPEGAVRG